MTVDAAVERIVPVIDELLGEGTPEEAFDAMVELNKALADEIETRLWALKADLGRST